MDETYVKVAGRWTYLYRAVDQHGQLIEVLVSTRRDAADARGFFTRALRFGTPPVQVTTDRAPATRGCSTSSCRRQVMSLSSTKTTESKPTTVSSRLACGQCPGPKGMRSARTISAGHAFVQNLRRGHYAITADVAVHDRLRVAFDELARCL